MRPEAKNELKSFRVQFVASCSVFGLLQAEVWASKTVDLLWGCLHR